MKNIMIFLQAYLLGRSGSRIVGLLLLLSLVWWAGPYVGLESENLRLWTITGILLFAGIVWLIRLLLLRRRAARFKAELQAQGGNAAGRELEIEELRTKMDEAIASLKSSELGIGYRGNAALYALPWFMLIGPSAAGKTTLLRNSGLHFPYAQGSDIDIKGFGGTRNCDWWFSNEAVILDTAGRYTTEEDDHEEWSAFLAMLKKYRARIPLNGVMVAVSLADLLTADEGGLEWHVKVIRDRLNELTSQLGCVFPVYIVLTKCDLLHGFEAYFQDLRETDRNQVWGGWLAGSSADGDLASRFEERMAELYQRLCELRLRKLSMERKFETKHEIFDFPAQFQATADKLLEFINTLVQNNPYQETPNFCGVYFTSATQEGTPIQRVIGNLRQAFGYVEDAGSNASSSPKSFFIKKIFQDVIFPNANGVSKNRRREVVHRWLKSLWVMTCLAAVAGAVLLLSTSLTSNTLLINHGSSTAKHLQQQMTAEEPSQEQTFAVLAEVYAHYQTLLAYEERLPWHLLLGVYQGKQQLDPTRTLLIKTLEKASFRPAVTSLEFRLENFARQWEAAGDREQEKIRDDYYQDLKVYLMLSDVSRIQPDLAVPTLVTLWKEQIVRGNTEKTFAAAEEQQMAEMLSFYLEHMQLPAEHPLFVTEWKSRTEIVERAREQLRTAPNAEGLYAQILSKGKISLKGRRLDDLTKGASFGVISSDITLPGIYTKKGWHELVEPEIDNVVAAASRGDWVIGYYRDEQPGADEASPDTENPQAAESLDEGSINSELAERLEAQIRELYFTNYANAWFDLLESVRINRFSSLEDASKKILLLARSDGPVGELLRAVSNNINLTNSTEGDLNGEPVAELDSPLRDLRKLTDPADKMTVSLLINQYLLAISTVQSELDRLAAAVDVQRESKLYAGNILSGGGASSELYKSWVSTSSLLNGIEARTRNVGSKILIAPLRHAWQAILQEAGKDLQREWRVAVLTNYNNHLLGRFPFDRKGSDAALVDLADFFRPDDGIYWSFVQEQLAPFIAEGRNSWREKKWLDLGLGFKREFLSSLSKAQNISDGLFRRGSDEPEIRFSVYPKPTRGLSEIYFESNGEVYRYRNEPQEWRPFRWSANAEKFGARVYGIDGHGEARAELQVDGIWGIFRLLDQAKVARESGTQFLNIWEMKGDNGTPVVVQFKFKADRENNLFDPNLFTSFNLPTNLF